MNSVAGALPTTASPVARAAAWRSVAGVFKPRIALEIMLSAVAGIALAGGTGLPWWQFLVVAASVFGAAGAAGALNQLSERDLDARMSRTQARPFVTGRFAGGVAWYALVCALLAGCVIAAGFATNWASATCTLLGALTYGVVYTLWLKRRTWLNIVIGGLAGSFAVLAGATAIDPVPGPMAWAFAVVLFLWTPPHFWSLATYYVDDYRNAGVPMLPVVFGECVAARVIFAHTIPLVLASFVPLALGAGWIYALGAVSGGAWFLWRTWQLRREPTPRNAILSFLASLLQLGLLLAAAIVEGAVRGTLIRF